MIRSFIAANKTFCIIVSAAVIVHCGIFFTFKHIAAEHPLALHNAFPIPGGGYDPLDYLDLGQNILHYGNFSMQPGSNAPAETYRTPGYPFFVAAVLGLTGNVDGIVFFQIILLAFAALIIYLTVLEIMPAYRWLALVVVSIFVFEPTIFMSTQFVATEVLYTTLFLLSVYLLVKKSSKPVMTWALAGFVLGLSALARPSGLYMSIPILIWITINFFKAQDRKQLLRQTGAFMLALLVIVSGWSLRNMVRTGIFGFSSLSAYNTLFNIPVYLSYKDKTPVEESRKVLTEKVGGLNDFQKRDIRNSAIMEKVAWEVLKPNIVNYTFYHVSKSANFFFSPGTKLVSRFAEGFWEDQPHDTWHPETSFINSLIEGRWGDVFMIIYQNILFFPETLVLVLMFIGGLYWSLFSPLKQAKLIVGLILFLGLLTSPITNARYRVPVMPLIYFSGLSGIVLAYQKLKKAPVRGDQDATELDAGV